MSRSACQPERSVSGLGADASRRIRLCVLDVDGTLLTSRHAVTAATREAVVRARARGLRVLLASSRGPRELHRILTSLDTPPLQIFVASQGAVTARYREGGDLEVLEHHPAPLTAALALVETALASGICVNWYSGARWYVPHIDSIVEAEARIVGHLPTVTDLTRMQVRPDKLLLISRTADSAHLQALAADLPTGLQAQSSKPTYLEITRSGVDKGSAVMSYCLRTGIHASEVLAIGDGLNDLTLFSYAGVSVAPTSAPLKVRAAADFLTLSNDENGVAYALEAIAH